MQIIKLAILANEYELDCVNWCMALEKFNISYDIINLSKSDWYEKLKKVNYDYLLAKPPVLTSIQKLIYDERIFIIDNYLKLPIYPTPLELYIYENKRFLYSWLKINQLPHPATHILSNKDEALEFVCFHFGPLVAKTSIGASGSGVKILRNKSDKIKYVENAFSISGVKKRWGPNLDMDNLITRGFNYIINPHQIKNKLNIYNVRKNDVQKNFVIFQEYIEHDFEWRIVAIGNSYFAHKKIKKGDKASGSLIKKYENPPIYLFDFTKNIMDKFGFHSQAIDIFENNGENLLINEMQCLFGQSDLHQMQMDGKPGRYKYINGNWIFEQGDFTNNECFDLRVDHVLSFIRNDS